MDISLLIPMIVPAIVDVLKKVVGDKLNPKWIPIILSLLGAGVGVTNNLLGTSFGTEVLTNDVISGVMLAWAGVGAHQTLKTAKKLKG